MAKRRTQEEIDAINADLRARYGDTLTRQNLLDYEQEHGVFPVWIYRDPSCKVGRGLYSIPGSAAPVAAPVKSKRARKTEEEPASIGGSMTCSPMQHVYPMNHKADTPCACGDRVWGVIPDREAILKRTAPEAPKRRKRAGDDPLTGDLIERE